MEQNSSSHIFILDTAAHWLGKRMREYSAPILASAIFGMLAYLFAFTNKLMNHDEVFCLFSKGATVDSGRWVWDCWTAFSRITPCPGSTAFSPWR